MNKKEITRDIKILSKKIYGKTPNFFNANENEIIIEENYLNIKNQKYNLNESLLECIINYLEKKIITENKFSQKLLIEYISIIKSLIANSNNEKVKKFVSKNISVLKQIINILINPGQSFNLYSSEIFLFKNKIELALGGLLKLLPNLEQDSKLLIKDSGDDDLSLNKDEKILRKIYSTFITNDSDIISLYIEPTKKIVIPILNRCDLSELEFMTEEYFSYRKIEVEVLNRKVYKSLLDKYKVNGRIKEGTKYPEVNDKMIIITEDLLKEIGISDKDYFESPKNIRKIRENKSQTLADENDDNLSQQEDENKEKDLEGSDFSLDDENDEEKSNKDEKEEKEEKEEKDEDKKENEDTKKEETNGEKKKEEIEKGQKKENEEEKDKKNEKKKDKAENYYYKKEPKMKKRKIRLKTIITKKSLKFLKVINGMSSIIF